MPSAPSGANAVHARHDCLHSGAAFSKRDLKRPQIQFADRLFARKDHQSRVIGLLIGEDHPAKNRDHSFFGKTFAEGCCHFSCQTAVFGEAVAVSSSHRSAVQVQGRDLQERDFRHERFLSDHLCRLIDELRIPRRRQNSRGGVDSAPAVIVFVCKARFISADPRLRRTAGHHVVDQPSSLAHQ